jgi:hypothetical protein
VVFTVWDRGGGVIEVDVRNNIFQAVDVFLNWSWGGVNGLSSGIVNPGAGTLLQADLPAGFDATLEIGAKRV